MALEGDERAPAPEGDVDDEIREGESRRDVVADTPDGRRLKRLLEATEDFGDDAEAYYEEALAESREHSAGVLYEIARAVGHCHEGDYPLRWSLTYAAATIGGKEALPLLANIAQTPIPEEVSPDPHSYSTVEEETIIRTTAVDGISELAQAGDQKAVDVLFELLNSPSFSIRRASVTGLKASPKGEELIERIAECLPKDERFLVDLQRVDVVKVDQVEDPRRHLSEVGLADAEDIPPAFDATRNGDIDQDRRRSPKTQLAEEEVDNDKKGE